MRNEIWVIFSPYFASKHKVIQLDIFGNIVNIFLNTVDAYKALNTTKNNICMDCNGKRKSAKRFIFRYEN